MKGLKKVTLGVAMATVPWFAHGITPMDDQALGEVTGQAGVTIELDTRVTIDQIDYSQGPSTGSVLVNGIEIGGFGPLNAQITENLDIKIDIDLQENGDALLRFGPMGFNPVDLGVSIDSAGLSDSSGTNNATLISDFDMRMWVSRFDLLAKVEDLQGNTGGSGSLEVEANFAIENLDVDFDVAAVSLEGFRLGGPGSLEGDQSNGLKDEDEFPNTNSVRLALDGADLSLSLGAGPSISGTGPSETLRVNIDNFVTDIWMPTINVGSGDSTGAASIGSVAIDNLDVSGTRFAIYGRQ